MRLSDTSRRTWRTLTPSRLATHAMSTYGHLFPNVRERIRVALEDTWDEGHRSAG
jgi:hypothetical protein